MRFYRHQKRLAGCSLLSTTCDGHQRQLIINHYWPAAILGHAFDDTVVQVTSCIGLEDPSCARGSYCLRPSLFII